jgi:hypothetical protein|tara:strand:+ start:247 stop:540 length:294 start_codon:yes stop_codon:yes gene_type:complete
MAEYIQIGALIEKDNGLDAYGDISKSDGVIYALLETGRSNDLFSEKQFGEFGEAAVLTLVVDAKQKNQVLEDLAKNLGLNEKGEGFVFEETALLKCS